MQTRREFLERVAAVSVATASANAPLTSIAAPAVKPDGSARRTRGVVQTVLGPIPASKLGFTLPHKHICERQRGRAKRPVCQ